MAIIQSEIAKGTVSVPQAFTSGAVVAHLAEFTIPTGTNIGASDIVELSILPGDHRVIDAAVVAASGFTTETADIGIMSGEVGSLDDTRTSNDVIFEAVELTGYARMEKGDAVVLPTTEKDRSIGLKFSGAVTGAGQKLTVLFLLAQ